MAFRTLAMMVVLWTGFALGGNAVESLLFVRFGPRILPHLFVALGVITFAIMLAVNAILGRSRPRRLLAVTPLAMAVVVVAMRGLPLLERRWVYPAMWVAMMVMWILAGVVGWGIAGAVHDTRQAKRLFPLYGSGLILGGAIGGLGTGPLARWLGTENLLLVWAAGLGGAFLLARSVLTEGGARAEVRRRPAGGVGALLAEGFRAIRASPLLLWMAISLALFAVLYFSLAFLFARAATARFPDADRLAGFLGTFMAAQSGTALIVSLFVANRLFARLGVATMVFVLSLVYVIGFGFLVVRGGFVPVLVFRFAQMVWVGGVWASAWQALFNVVPPERRDGTRAFIDGAAFQAGVVSAGALLLAARELQPAAIAVAVLLGSVLAAAAAHRLRRAYTGAVVEALRAGNPEVFLTEEEPFGGVRRDAAAFALVSEAAADPDPAVRRISMEILAEAAEPGAAPMLTRGVTDGDPVVRAAALRGIVRIGAAESLERATGLLEDSDASVRLAAVEAVAAAGNGRRPADRLRALLDDPDHRVRARVCAILLASPASAEAERTLEEMAGSPAPEWRAAAISALGDAGRSTDTISSGLRDPDPMVRRAAASSLARRLDATAAGRLVRALADPDPGVRAAAVEGLAAIGEPAREAVLDALARPELEAGAVRVLARLEAADPSIIAAYVRRESALAVRYGELRQALDGSRDDRVDLVAYSLRYRSLQHTVDALEAASQSWDEESVRLAIDGLASRDASQRANALEILDAVGEPDVVRPLLRLWESVGDGTADVLRVLEELLRDGDAWLRACAAFAAGTRADLRPAVERLARSDPDGLVREAAAAALGEDRVVKTLPSLSLMERIVFLRRVPLFEDLAPADLKHVAEIAVEHAYPDGEVIAEQGEPGEEMYVVVSGEIMVLVSRNEGPSREVARRTRGHSVGEMAVVSRAPRMASLVTSGEVRTLAIDRGRFERILRERPEASLAVMGVLCNRLRESHGAEPDEARG